MAPESQPKVKQIAEYDHQDKTRVNNPPIGLVTPETDPDTGKKKPYQYDPHLDPQLVWAGKIEHTSFDVPVVSLHVHERIEPRTIIEAARKRGGEDEPQQLSFFEKPLENPPLRQAIEFYTHKHDWSNRLIAGDSLLVMNSLMEKEGMAAQVQMAYVDPPYGIKYGSNFQPFVNKRKVQDGKDEDLTAEPEMVKAFRDTWELGIHSYLSYLRDRLLLVRDLLNDTGSVFVQISDTNVHLVRCLLDEIFGTKNFVAMIDFKTMMPLESGEIESVFDYLCWYAKDKSQIKYRNLFVPKAVGEGSEFVFADTDDGGYRRLTDEEIKNFDDTAKTVRIFKRSDLASSGYTPSCTFPIEFQGKVFQTKSGKSWRTTPQGIENLKKANRLFVLGSKLYYKMYLSDFGYGSLVNSWQDTIEFSARIYAVQTTQTVIQRCLLMSTDPGDLVFDPTCGSGTTACVAEQWGRRWITCDSSRVAIALAKQRLMTGVFDYYELAHPEEGVGGGFNYRTVPHIKLETIANKEPAKPETLYDQPLKDPKKGRVTGPFTVEAVPSPVVKPISDFAQPAVGEAGNSVLADQSVARSGETLRQREWRDELLKTGIRGKGGQRIEFSRVEPLSGTRYLNAEAETKGDVPALVAVCFGPEHAPLEPRLVSLALEEAQTLVPRPRLVVFAAFQFDPEAAKDIDEIKWPGVTLLKAQMSTDLLTEDLKKKRASNDSFWLMGQPDAELRSISVGEDKGKWQVEVRGFDYFDTRTGELVSGGVANIAMWLLDPDYDGWSLYPRQVFFPMAGEKDGWARLAKSLKAEIDEDLIEAYRGTISLPFELGKHRRVAVKIVDDRGIESLKVIEA